MNAVSQAGNAIGNGIAATPGLAKKAWHVASPVMLAGGILLTAGLVTTLGWPAVVNGISAGTTQAFTAVGKVGTMLASASSSGAAAAAAAPALIMK